MLLSFSETDKPSVVPDPQHYSLSLPIKVESLAYRIILAIEHRAFLEVSPYLSQAGSSPAGRYLDHCLCWYLVVFLHILPNLDFSFSDVILVCHSTHFNLEVSVSFFHHFCKWVVPEGFLNSRKPFLHYLLGSVVFDVTINLPKAIFAVQNVLFHILIYCAGLAPCWLILFNPILCCTIQS